VAKPIKLKDSEQGKTLYECRCGQTQTDALVKCRKCHRFLCDICMSFESDVCVDCDSDMDEVDF